MYAALRAVPRQSSHIRSPMTHIRRSIFASLVLAMFAGAFIACGGDAPTQVVVKPPVDTTTKTPPPIVVASVVVTGPAKMTVGRTDSVKAQPRQSDGTAITGKTAAWTSSNAAAVTVGAATGLLTAVAPGTATITATIDGIVGSISVTTTDASITSLAIAPLTGSIFIGAIRQLVPTARDSVNATVAIRSITWTSASPNVATVSPTGVVAGVAAGTAVISAAVFGATASTTVTVVPVPVASIVFAPFDSVLHLRFPKQVVATALDSAGNVLTGRAFTYKSSNVDVATFDPFGLLTASGFTLGTDTVTVSTGGKSASTRYFVPPDSGLYVATVGGVPGDPVNVSIDVPNATFPSSAAGLVPADGVSRFNFVTSNGNYRVRTSTTVDPARSVTAPVGIALLLGSTVANVPVTLGPPSAVVSILMAPYTATITAPASVGRSTPVTVSWTFDESKQPFSFFPDALPTGMLYWSSTNGIDLSGTPVAATVTRDPSTLISTFTATFTAPPSAGTIFLQVEGDGPISRLLYPIVFRGQGMRTIAVQ